MDMDQKIGMATLTLEDLSYLLCTECEMPEDVHERLRHDILGDPRYGELLAHGEQLRRDTGCPELWQALAYGADFERLLEAEGWDDPAEILMPGHEDLPFVGHRQLIGIADARIARGEATEKLSALKERVERAECKPLEETLEDLLSRVRRLSPASAARMVARASTALAEALAEAQAKGNPADKRSEPSRKHA